MVRVIHGLVHAHESRCQVQEQRRFQFSSALVFGSTFDQVSDVDGHEVYDFGRRVACQSRKAGLQMRLVTLCGYHDDCGDSVVVPTCEEFVDGTVGRLPAKCAGARIRRPVRFRQTVVEGRRDDDAKAGREGAGHTLRYERVRTQRQMGSVVIQRTYRQDESGIALEVQTNFRPGQVVQLV